VTLHTGHPSSVGLLLLGLAMMSPEASATPQPPGATVNAVSYADLPEWSAQDHALIATILRRHCQTPLSLRAGAPRPPSLQQACTVLAETTGPARSLIEQLFQPFRITPHEGTGFLTGYFEPEFEGSLTPSPEFPVPLYDRPSDLVTRPQEPDPAWAHLGDLQGARRDGDRLAPYADRAAIDAGAVEGKAPVILWLRDIVDRFVMQVQGSARIRLRDGGSIRLAYSGRNGHPYTSLGRVLVEEEGIAPADMTMDRLVARLKSDLTAAQGLIARNRSFVFFRIASELPADSGPIGGAGLPLTAHHSFAADREIWPYGLPAMLHGVLPDGAGGSRPLARLGVIEDTGSAIKGPARIDLFFGSGAVAGHAAGLVRHKVDVTILWPRPQPGR
jgi:membrane-bound lytic murein transglycosylase A